MKRIITITLVLALALGLAACTGGNGGTTAPQSTKVKIGITGESENVIWDAIKPALAEKGIEIEIINFADYTLLNGALSDGDIDLNAFQHHAYLDSETSEKGYALAALGDTYISAMSIYSASLTDVSQVKQGDKVAIPGDRINLGRALSVLQGAGLLELGEQADGVFDMTSITANPLGLVFVEVDASQIPALLPDVAIGVINCNYALDFGLSPRGDAIFYDDVSFYPDNRYANLIASRAGDAQNETYLAIVAAYQSEAVENVYAEQFDGAYLPAWK